MSMELMSMTRRLALGVLTVVIRHSSSERQLWGNAMLRELDFIEGDWAALFWAFGSTAALCRHSVTSRLRTLSDRRFNETFQLKKIAKKTTGILSGVVVAGTVLVLCVGILIGLIRFALLQQENGRLADRLLIVVIPETLYLVAVITLWRRRKSVALGILLAGMILVTHAVIHFANHG
jgi:hypothetical protein